MINFVPQATGLRPDGSPDAALLQAMAARKKAQLDTTGGQRLTAAASTQEPIYSRAHGFAKLLAGGLGGIMEGNEARQKVETAKQGAMHAAGLAQSLGLSPEQAKQIQGMYLANPEAASALVKQMSERLFAKPDAKFVDERLPDGSLAQRNASTNELAVRRPTDILSTEAERQKVRIAQEGRAQNTVNVGGGSDKQFFDTLKESADSARAAVTGLTGLREARRAVAGGGFFGAGADTKLAFNKLAATLGLGDNEKIVNTETFRSAIAPQISAMMKATVGSTQISNADREFAEKAAGGSISLDERSITRLLDIMERGSMSLIEGHKGKLDQVYPETPDGKFNRERAVFGVQPPAPPPAPQEAQGPAIPPDLAQQVVAAQAGQAAATGPAPAPGGLTLDMIEAELQRRQAAQQQAQPQPPYTDPMGGQY